MLMVDLGGSWWILVDVECSSTVFLSVLVPESLYGIRFVFFRSETNFAKLD